MVKEIVCSCLNKLKRLLIFLISIGEHRAVDAPGLSSCPSGIIACALSSYALLGKTCFNIEVVGVVCTCICTAANVDSCVEVVDSDLSVILIACYLSSPEKKRYVQVLKGYLQLMVKQKKIY